MKTANRRICTFTFGNGTKLRCAIEYYNNSFERILEDAKLMCWNGDETKGRSGLVSFEIGDYIVV